MRYDSWDNMSTSRLPSYARTSQLSWLAIRLKYPSKNALSLAAVCRFSPIGLAGDPVLMTLVKLLKRDLVEICFSVKGLTRVDPGGPGDAEVRIGAAGWVERDVLTCGGETGLPKSDRRVCLWRSASGFRRSEGRVFGKG